MELDSLNKALNKLAPHMLRKIPIEFTITINKSQFYDEFSTYEITYTFTIDHSKFWEGKSFAGEPNPNFDENYNVEVNKLYNDDYENELDEVPKYLGINDFNMRILYEHIKTDAYEPLVNYLNEKYPNSFEIVFSPSIPVLMIEVTDFNTAEDNLFIELEDEGFNMNDIIIK
jgi:hypothetical protein